MNFLGLGPGELLLVMVLALIVFGPQKLPQIGRDLGKAVAEFRRTTSDITQEFNRELQLESILNPPVQTAATTMQEAPIPPEDAAPAPTEDLAATPILEEPTDGEAETEPMTIAPAADEAEVTASVAGSTQAPADGPGVQIADEGRESAPIASDVVEVPQAADRTVEG